jgi:hypothetical protein
MWYCPVPCPDVLAGLHLSCALTLPLAPTPSPFPPLLPPGGVQTLISCPVELLKIRLQLQQAMPGTPGYVGPWAMAGQVVAGEGVAGERGGRRGKRRDGGTG